MQFAQMRFHNTDLMDDFQRKPEGSPEKEGEVKKVKHDDAEADAVQHTNGDTNGHNWLKVQLKVGKHPEGSQVAPLDSAVGSDDAWL